MRRGLIPVLVTLIALLAGGLAALWVGTDGRLRNVHWTPPAAIKPDLSGMLAPLGGRRADDVGQLVAMADRPLFSPTRRPPPPPAPPAPPDPLAGLQILGVYTTPEGGAGVIVRVDGRVRRASGGERIADWSLKSADDREVIFVRGAESRSFRMARPRGERPGASPAPGIPPAGAQGTQAPPATPMTGAQRVEEEERARLRAINEMNIRNGLPPVTQR